MKRMLSSALFALLLVGAAPFAAAAEPTPPTTPSTPPATASAPPTAAAPTDAEIAHVTITANTIDIDGGKLAKKKTENPEVLAFAERMIGDHTALNTKVDELADRLQLTPADNPTSQALTKDQEATMAMLKGLDGAAFDRAYLGHEVTFHATLLDQVDRVLLPNAKDPGLKTVLEGARPIVAAHLEHARQLSQQLDAAAPPALTH